MAEINLAFPLTPLIWAIPHSVADGFLLKEKPMPSPDLIALREANLRKFVTYLRCTADALEHGMAEPDPYTNRAWSDLTLAMRLMSNSMNEAMLGLVCDDTLPDYGAKYAEILSEESAQHGTH